MNVATLPPATGISATLCPAVRRASKKCHATAKAIRGEACSASGRTEGEAGAIRARREPVSGPRRTDVAESPSGCEFLESSLEGQRTCLTLADGVLDTAFGYCLPFLWEKWDNVGNKRKRFQPMFTRV